MNYKGDRASISAKHSYLRAHYGRPTYCMNKECEGRSKCFDWAKKTESEYTNDPKDYLWLCRVCHRRYDMTPEKREQAIKNLVWVKRNFKTKLSWDKAREIRARLANGEIAFRLAKEFGVDKSLIKQIKYNQIWKEDNMTGKKNLIN